MCHKDGNLIIRNVYDFLHGGTERYTRKSRRLKISWFVCFTPRTDFENIPEMNPTPGNGTIDLRALRCINVEGECSWILQLAGVGLIG